MLLEKVPQTIQPKEKKQHTGLIHLKPELIIFGGFEETLTRLELL